MTTTTIIKWNESFIIDRCRLPTVPADGTERHLLASAAPISMANCRSNDNRVTNWVESVRILGNFRFDIVSWCRIGRVGRFRLEMGKECRVWYFNQLPRQIRKIRRGRRRKKKKDSRVNKQQRETLALIGNWYLCRSAETDNTKLSENGRSESSETNSIVCLIAE